MNQLLKIGISIGDKFSKWQYTQASMRGKKEYFENFKDEVLPALSSEERLLINKKWRGVCPDLSIGYHAYRVFKKYDKFDEHYVPESYFYPYIIRILNTTQDFESLVHKGLIDSLFSDMSRPETLIKSFGSSFLDKNYSSIHREQIIDFLHSFDCDMIIKPAKDSNSGRGISIINKDFNEIELNNLIDLFHTDFVIQRIVKQSDFTSQFNPTSLNTFRILTLFLNGKCSLCYAILKLGAPGRFVDNGANGGLWVGVKKDGNLNDWGINFQGIVHYEHNGISLKNKKVPNFENIVSFAQKAHAHIPMCGLVGWDIALDSNEKPLLIEANMWWPGISYGEICSGPIFKSRTDEVIDYVKSQELPRLGFRHKI